MAMLLMMLVFGMIGMNTMLTQQQAIATARAASQWRSPVVAGVLSGLQVDGDSDRLLLKSDDSASTPTPVLNLAGMRGIAIPLRPLATRVIANGGEVAVTWVSNLPRTAFDAEERLGEDAELELRPNSTATQHTGSARTLAVLAAWPAEQLLPHVTVSAVDKQGVITPCASAELYLDKRAGLYAFDRLRPSDIDFLLIEPRRVAPEEEAIQAVPVGASEVLVPSN